MVFDRKARKLLALVAIFMASAIALGAFGAHGLKKVLAPEMLAVYKTGVEYQFYNSLGLFIAIFIYMLRPYSKKILIAIYLLIAGTLIFSISLYLLTILNIPTIGVITPIGGTLQIIAWLVLAYGLIRD